MRTHGSNSFVEFRLARKLTLKAPRKNASEKRRLLKSSVANNYLILLTNEACIGGLPVSYILGSKQESISYPFK